MNRNRLGRAKPVLGLGQRPTPRTTGEVEQLRDMELLGGGEVEKWLRLCAANEKWLAAHQKPVRSRDMRVVAAEYFARARRGAERSLPGDDDEIDDDQGAIENKDQRALNARRRPGSSGD